MGSMDKLAKELKTLVNASDERKPSPYDTQAEVVRVEGNTAWVHIPGGVEETPVRRTIDAKKGDMVNVHVASGSAWITGNATRPPTDDTVANIAKDVATGAQNVAQMAWDYAESAHEAADVAWAYADSAHVAADTAWTHAENARVQAVRATGYANDALTQLGTVEEVVDTLNWISEHGTYKLSTDTSVINNKMYFTLTGTVVSPTTLADNTKLSNLESYYEKSGNIYIKTTDTTYNPSKTYYTVSAELVANPTGNPSINGYYEIDSVDTAVQNYISSHLALTDSGLYVVKDNQGYKVLLANDGLRIYDDTGHLVSTFGENITFDSSRPQTIGNNTSYIRYYDSNRDGVPDSIEISGSNVSITSDVSIGGMPTKVSDLTNDAGYQDSSQVSSAINSATSSLASSVTAKDQYYLSTSSSSATGGSWQDTIPTWSSGKYIWTRVATTTTTSTGSSTVYTPTNGQYDGALTTALSTASSAQTSANGAASTVVTNKQYYLSTSSSSATGGSWQDTIPTWSSGKYIWTRYKIVTTPVSGTATTTYSPSENGIYDSGLTTTLQKANDAATKSEAVASTVSVYYRSTTATTPSISTATTIGTSASTDNAWEYVMPQPKRDRYFYTCERYTKADGTVSFSTVRSLDNATYTSKWCHASDNVYIDGGKIYANSVTADQMAANSITIGNMDSSTKSQVENSQLAGDITAAGNTAKSYLYADNNGLRIASANPSTQNQRIHLTSSQMNLYDSNNKKRTTIDSNGLNVYANDGTTSVAEFGTSMRVGKTSEPHIEVKSGGMQVYRDSSNVIANIGYESNNPYYTFGNRATGTIGNNSFVLGQDNVASGSYSHAEGYKTKATRDYQFVTGKWNKEDSNALFIIGSGTSEQYRENAFTVNNMGSVYLEGHSTPVGDYLQDTCGEKGTARNVSYTLCTINIPYGTWALLGIVSFEASTSGVRRIVISPNPADAALSTLQNWTGVQVSPASAGPTILNTTLFVTDSTTGRNFYLCSVHTASSDLNVSWARFMAIRIS